MGGNNVQLFICLMGRMESFEFKLSECNTVFLAAEKLNCVGRFEWSVKTFRSEIGKRIYGNKLPIIFFSQGRKFCYRYSSCWQFSQFTILKKLEFSL